MKNQILFLLLIITFSSCRVLKKDKIKEVKNDVQLVEKQTDNQVQAKEEIITEKESQNTNLQETETLETETVVEENFDTEGKLVNRKTSSRTRKSNSKSQNQEVKKEQTTQQFNFNSNLTEVLKTFGQQYSSTESKVKEVKGVSFWWYVAGVVIGGIIIYLLCPKQFIK